MPARHDVRHLAGVFHDFMPEVVGTAGTSKVPLSAQNRFMLARVISVRVPRVHRRTYRFLHRRTGPPLLRTLLDISCRQILDRINSCAFPTRGCNRRRGGGRLQVGESYHISKNPIRYDCIQNRRILVKFSVYFSAL